MITRSLSAHTGPATVPDDPPGTWLASPPSPFAPLTESWDADSRLYRVYCNNHRAAEFNLGEGKPTRFAFFSDPRVPVRYAAQSEQAAVAETILHDVPLRAGQISEEDYLDRVMARLSCHRPLVLAQFCGPGLRKLGVRAKDLTDTEAGTYLDTVVWVRAVWEHTTCDGIVWMSRHWNTARSGVLFGDRVAERELSVDAGFARAFINPTDLE